MEEILRISANERNASPRSSRLIPRNHFRAMPVENQKVWKEKKKAQPDDYSPYLLPS